VLLAISVHKFGVSGDWEDVLTVEHASGGDHGKTAVLELNKLLFDTKVRET
jgi:hypothetical protein